MDTLALIITILVGFALLYSALVSDEAVDACLIIWGDDMATAKVGDKFLATVSPKNAAGEPAPVLGAEFAVQGPYTFEVNPDGLSAVYTAAFVGSGGLVEVALTAKSGSGFAKSAALPDVEPVVDEEAVDAVITVVPFIPA